MVTTAIEGRGTTESEWAGWLETLPRQPLDCAAAAGRTVVVVAAHPDDEVLGAAALIGDLAARGCELVMVWATDGEASHPGSTAISPTELAAVRRVESQSALARLGVRATATHHLGLSDGGLASSTTLASRLSALIGPDDVVIAPWQADGHQDHEAVGEACSSLGAICWQYPVWMWHWSRPGDDRVPWHRMRVVPVADLGLKAAAIEEFVSQVRPIGPAPADEAVLPPAVTARFLRPFEWYVV